VKLAIILATMVVSLVAGVSGARAAQWSLHPYPNYAWGTGAAPMDGDHVLVAGGLGFPSGSYAALRRTFGIFHTAASWSDAAVPELPSARAGSAVITSSDGRVYVLGGFVLGAGGRLVPVAGALSFAAGETSWTGETPLPVARGLAGAAAAPNGDIWLISGYVRNAAGTAQLSSSVAIYHPGTGSWTQGPSLPAARDGLVAVTSGGRIYVIGGWNGGQRVDVWSIDPADASPAWTAEPDLPSPHQLAGAVADADGRIFVIGGWNGRQDLRRVDTYQPVDGAWACSMKLNTARSWNSAAFLPANVDHPATIYTFAGARGRYLLKSSETSLPDAAEVDGTGPTGTAPVPHVAPLQAPLSGLPMVLTWTSADSLTDVLAEHLQRSTDGITWTDYPVVWQTLRPAYFHQPNASRLQFRTTPEDCLGNSGATHTGVAFSAWAVQVGAGSYQGGWLTAASALHQGGHTRYSSTAGARAAYRFYGREIALLGPKGPTRGAAYIAIDGHRIAAVTEYARTGLARMVVFRRAFATLGWHTISATVAGTAGRPRFDVDAFLVIGKPTAAGSSPTAAPARTTSPPAHAGPQASRALPLGP
jgi:hypothetical protein